MRKRILRLARVHVPPRFWGISGNYIVLLAVLAGTAWAIFVLQTFGQRESAFASIAGILLLIVVGPRLASGFLARRRSGLAQYSWRSIRFGRRGLIGGLACWLGLLAWSSLSAGGLTPPPKSDSAATRVVTWNILHGRDYGAPWTRYGWSARKKALRCALAQIQPEILCVQEALAEQVDSLAAMLPEHNHVGVGRDDGRSAGEFCAIFYDSRRFAPIESGTFWLEEPTDKPPSSLHLGPKRICTWARLFDRTSGRFVRVYNTHLYLTEKARRCAGHVILERIAEGEPTDAVLVTGDFNAAPGAASRLLFEAAGLKSAAKIAGGSPNGPTYHFYGLRLRNLDEIYCSRGSSVNTYRVLDVKPGNTYPSDHFGVIADVHLAERLR